MKANRTGLAEALLFGLCMIVFAFCAGRPALMIPRIITLMAAAAVLARSLGRADHPLRKLGLSRQPLRRLVLLIPLAAVGIGAGAYYRFTLGLPPLPRSLGWFAMIAAAIGACEELAYRGFVQGWVHGATGSIWLGCAAGAAFHTAYKAALFAFPPPGVRVNLPVIAAVTFVGGFVFGLVRQRLGGLAFPLAVHAAFDIAAYGDLTAAPWWVWGT